MLNVDHLYIGFRTFYVITLELIRGLGYWSEGQGSSPTTTKLHCWVTEHGTEPLSALGRDVSSLPLRSDPNFIRWIRKEKNSAVL